MAFDRATPSDISAMRDGLTHMAGVSEARGYLTGIIRVRRALVAASRVAVLDDMQQAVVALLGGGLSRAVFVDGHEEMLRHSFAVHTGIVDHDRTRFDKVMNLHNEDLVRADDPGRSPEVERTRPRG